MSIIYASSFYSIIKKVIEKIQSKLDFLIFLFSNIIF